MPTTANEPRGEVYRFSIPLPIFTGAHIDLGLQRVGERRFRAAGEITLTRALSLTFRAAGEFAVKVQDPTGLVPQIMGLWPQLVNVLKTASTLGGSTEASDPPPRGR